MFRSSLSPEPRRPLAGLRVLIADQDVVKVEALARAFRAHGALVEVSNYEPDAARMRHLRSFDPILVVADEAKLVRSGAPLVDRFREDVILRWAHWFGSDWNQVWNDVERQAKIESWLAPIHGFYLTEAEFSRLVRLGANFTMSASTLGPGRILRRLARAAGIVRANLEATTTSAVVEMCDGQITGAHTNHGKRGIDALAEILTWRCATVDVCFAYELEFHDFMVRSAQALEQAVTRLVDSEEDLTIHEDSSGAVAAALTQARREIDRETPGTPFPLPLDPGHESTLSGSTQPLLRTTSAAVTTKGWLGMVAGVVAAGTGAGLLLLQLLPEPAPPAAALSPVDTSQQAQVTAKPIPATHSRATPSAPPARKADEKPPVGAQPSETSPATTTRCDTVQLAQVNRPGPRQAMREIHRGRRALVAGELKVAEQAFCTAAAIDPSGPMFQQLAKFYIERDEPHEALVWAARALDATPTNTHAKLYKVDALALNGDDDSARQLLRGALGLPTSGSLNDRVVARFASAGDRTLNGGDVGQAARFYRRALLLDPSHSGANAGLARVLLRRDDAPGALGNIERAIAASPKKASYYLLRGDVYQALGEEAQARASWQRALSLDPRSIAAKKRLG